MTDSGRLGCYTSVVSAARSCNFHCISCTAQLVSCRWCCSASVENCSHSTNIIASIPKVSKQVLPGNLRPVLITPVLLCVFERHLVQQYIYPVLDQPSLDANFHHQFAFRPSGSTTAAIIALLDTAQCAHAVGDTSVRLSVLF